MAEEERADNLEKPGDDKYFYPSKGEVKHYKSNNLDCPACGGRDSIINGTCQMPGCGALVDTPIRENPQVHSLTVREATIIMAKKLQLNGFPVPDEWKPLLEEKPPTRRTREVKQTQIEGDPFSDF